jgi:uncharacterized protein YgbK (DUF1537 family)
MTWLGVVADDLTGAGDVADAVVEQGASAAVVVGPPSGPPPAAVDCVVVALKSRTAPRAAAVADSLAAARWLRDAGCTTLYQKYCSTFDSTDEGNIGPVADALRELLGGAVAVGTPATPRVGRTVYCGHLFVGRQLLSDSPLRDHPLTPMRDSDLVRVLGRQTRAPVTLVDWQTVARGPAAVAAAIADASGHVLVDALTEADLDAVAVALRPLPQVVVAGAAGLAAALTRVRVGGAAAPVRDVPAVPDGRRLILSGSCSARTLEQVDRFTGPRIPLSPDDLHADFTGTVATVLDRVRDALRTSARPVLVSSSAPPDRQARDARSSLLLEAATAEVAVRAVDSLGVRRLLVAGGETSGAVVAALGLSSLRVGPAAGPGLPWLVPDAGVRLAVLLKSGNFGDPDLFTSAWDSCP